jgi:hypothetical protein
MTIKYTSIGPPKFTQIGTFGLKTNHLATLVAAVARSARLTCRKKRNGFEKKCFGTVSSFLNYTHM